MMELWHHDSATELSEITDLLKEYTFAHKVISDNSLKSIHLVSGKLTIEGKENVLKYVRRLIEETGQWWYCQCTN